MVAVLLYTSDQPSSDLGFRKETVAYLGGIQHHMGLDLMHGIGTTLDLNYNLRIICTDSSLKFHFPVEFLHRS